MDASGQTSPLSRYRSRARALNRTNSPEKGGGASRRHQRPYSWVLTAKAWLLLCSLRSSPLRSARSASKLWVLAFMLGSAQAKETETRDEPTSGERAIAVGVAVVPGVLVHGAGSYALGRKTTALRLVQLEALGIGLVALGTGLLFASGSTQDFEGPGATLALAGAGLFTVSFLADVYSVTTPSGGLGRDPGWTPLLEGEVGYRYVYDPHFDYRNFVVSGLTGRLGQFRLSPSLWSSPENANQRARVEGAYRLYGPTPDSRSESGSFVDVDVAFTSHRFGFEGFRVTTGEASLQGRWDLATYDPHLTGAFVDYGVGAATRLHHWDSGDEIASSLLLLRVGFGVYLGDQSPRGGYVRAYYDHRHDDLAGGMPAFGVGRDPPGYFGLEGLYYFTESWGALVDARLGSAMLLGASGLFRFGGDE